MKVDVVIPYYNKTLYINRAINSIDFTFINKIIIVDDCSPEPLLKINNPNIISIRNEVNSGPSYSRNMGAKLSNADYLLFLDADDFYNTAIFKILNDLLTTEKKIELITWKIKTILDQEKIKNNEEAINIVEKDKYFYHKEKAKGNLVMTASSFCIRRDLFLINNGFNESIRVQEDPEFFCRISKKYKTIYINNVMSYYDLSDPQSLSKVNFNSIQLPLYVSNLKNDSSKNSINLFKTEFIRYYFLSLLNKSNGNYKEFISYENIKHIGLLRGSVVLISSIIPSFLYINAYKIFRHIKYGR